MNSIPLIKGNTPQEINTSIIALKKALSELEAQDRLLQGTDKDVQDKIKQINELIEGINTHLGTVDTHLTTVDGQITALQPVDTVTSGNMQSVTSNAVANHYKVKTITKSYTITANGSYSDNFAVSDEGYKTLFAIVTATGDNKVYVYNQYIFSNNNNFYVSLQNWNGIQINQTMRILVFQEKVY